MPSLFPKADETNDPARACATRAFSAPAIFSAGLLSLVVCAAGGCSTVARWSGNSNTLTIENVDDSRVIAPTFTTSVYLPVDPQTAEVYLTDLPLDRLRDGKDTLEGLSGHILHIHLFLLPSAGSTPIDQTACNITLRHIVIAQGEGKDQSAIGLYSGGGFVLPAGTIGDDRIGGSISGSSHRLVKASARFNDPLGSGAITGRFDAQRNDDAARALGSRIESLARTLKPIDDKAKTE